MTSAFGVFANSGVRLPPVSILKITDFQGNVVYEYKPPQGEQVIRPEHAYLITSILSDNEARSWMFGTNSALNLSFPVAAKTGTTNDFRDNWTLGYTPDLVTGVWVGNADYTPMINTTGTSGAAPIWSQFMENAAPYVAAAPPRLSAARMASSTRSSARSPARNHRSGAEASGPKCSPPTRDPCRPARICAAR